MASDSERGISPSKGLSFIDWESLDEEEFVKLNRIINKPNCGARVQFPFPQDTHAEVSSKAHPDSGVAQAPVFQPGVPPPSVVGFPIPVRWPPGNPGLASHGAAPYPITVHSGYVFPNPALTASGEGTVAFVTAISNGHPVYAIPGVGHPIPAHFQGGPIPASEVMPMTVPITGDGNETVIASMPPTGQAVLQPHTLPTIPPHLAQNGQRAAIPAPVTQLGGPVSLTEAGVPAPMTHAGVPVSHTQQPAQSANVTQQGVPASLAAPQPQMAPVPPQPAGPQSNAPVAGDMLGENKLQASSNAPAQPPAVRGLPQEASVSSSIEFGGPVVFEHQRENLAQTEPNNNKVDTPEQRDSKNQEIVIDMRSVDISESNEPGTIIPNEPAEVERPANAGKDSSSNALIEQQAPPTVNVETVQSVESASSPSPVPQQTAVKTWSSLFSSSSQGVKSSSVVSSSHAAPQHLPTANIDTSAFPAIGDSSSAEAASSKEEKLQYVLLEKVTAVGVHSDPLAHRLQDQLYDLRIVHTPIVIQPRGLKNGQNTCFLNAPLQVLMGCPPFVHMFRSFKNLPSRAGGQSSTPILDSLVNFVNSFQNGQRMRNSGSRNKKGGIPDLNVGQAFIPEPLLSVAQNILGLHIGVQHDAEEFLSQILSICNEEMENILQMEDSDVSSVKQQDDTPTVNGNDSWEENHKAGEDEDDNNEAWQQVGPRNHHVETNVNDCGQTPLSSIFAGLSRSCLIRESGKTSDTLDSFFTLKLDIQPESVHSVKDALLRLNTTETVHDADGRKVHGQRRMFFDVLPPVLIMHLKLFEYSNGNGQKIQKKVTFDVDLHIPKEIISRVGKTKYASSKSRNYKLFGVVNHHGRKMNDGHYTSDVFLPVASGWLRFDDSEIMTIQEADVLYYRERSMPYLLFYRRMDVS